MRMQMQMQMQMLMQMQMQMRMDKGLEMTNSSWLGRRENSWQDSDQGKARRYALLKPSSSGHRETHSLGRWRS